ncbi:MAG: hypothetical protein ACR2OA_15615 [Rubripirellula sp.]
MRLTLRTLLAYLDNTLDPQDAELLKNKLAESGFATQMVQRIRGLLTQADLPAPSPLARGPVEEANVICEYLDSTLPVEQVAEVERACLDSDPHLAEAAACHQILTMVLENPASVPVVLRDRIYQLPGEKRGTENKTGSFSALAIPEPVNSFDAPSSQVLSSEVPPPPSQEPVRPVGVGDSGVMAAPARLRQRELADDQAAKKGPAIAGSRPLNPQSNSGVYGGQIRSSRITPWLVTLGLTAVLLYALTQIFQPLMDSGTTAGIENTTEQSSPLENEDADDVGNDEANTGELNAEPNIGSDVAKNDAGVGEPSDSGSGGSEADNEPAETPAAEVMQSTSSGDEAKDGGDAKVDNSEMNQGDAVDDSTLLTTPSEDSTGDRSPVVATPPVPLPPAPQLPEPKPPGVVTPSPEEMEQETPDENDTTASKSAKVISDGMLLAVETGGQWQRLGKDAEIGGQQPLVVGPGFRAKLAIPDAEITMVGPSSAMLLTEDAGTLAVQLTSGRMLVSAGNPEASVQIQLGEEKCRLQLASPDTIAAIELTHKREPGLDPLLAETHVAVRHLIAVNGSVTAEIGGLSSVIESENQWTQVGEGEPSLEPLGAVPDWATEVAPNADVLATTARQNLMAMLDDAPSLEIGLRELLGFRRSEVADLAARSLLVLGKSDVYFGGAGVFSDPKQRAYWPQHYEALLARVNSGPEAASEVQQAIKKMDAAAEVQLFRMLTGYTNEQLETGSDLQLLENLDSADMSVRVLAFENLRRITGVTFNYRAEHDSQARREQYMKKWRVRQRKGEIRWKE